MDPIDHPVSRYALDVVSGRTVAGRLVHLACERHLRDLDNGAEQGLIFDCAAANRVLRFAGLIRHTTGPLAGKPLDLQPWQVFRHGSIFGWKHMETGHRRFRLTYHQVGKKNGKTTDTAIPMLYTQLFDGEAAPQGYCAAKTRDQASLLFREMKRMICRSGALSQLMAVYQNSIVTEHAFLEQAVFQRQIGNHFFQGCSFKSQFLHLGTGRLSRRVTGQALFAGLQKLLGPGIIEAFADRLTTAKRSNALLAPQARQYNADIFFYCM